MTKNTSYDEVAERYDDIYRDNLSKAEDKAFVRKAQTLISEIADSQGTIIDVGSGTGWLIDHFNIPNSGYKGFDISPSMVNISSKKHPDYFFDIQDMTKPWGDTFSKADLITSLWTVGNYDSTSRHLRYISQRLNSKGKAIVIVHTDAFFLDKRRSQGKVLPTDCYATNVGWRSWNANEIKKVAERYGLSVKIEPFRHWKALPAWLPTWAHSLWLKIKPVKENNALFLILWLEAQK